MLALCLRVIPMALLVSQLCLPALAKEDLKDGSFQLKKVLESDAWLAAEFQNYQHKEGYKAFAIYWEKGFVKAFGFSEDKLTAQFARQEALTLCNAYAQITAGCQIVDEDGTSRSPLTQGSFPAEVSAYRDLKHWHRYQSSTSHKAIAGNIMGILGSGYQSSKAKAEREALQQCYQNTHFSAPHCYIIASE